MMQSYSNPVMRADRRLAIGLALLALCLGMLTRVGAPLDARGEASWETTRRLAGFESTHLPPGTALPQRGESDPVRRADDGGGQAAGGLGGALIAVPLDWGSRAMAALTGQDPARARGLSRRATGWRDVFLLALGIGFFVLSARRLGARRREILVATLALLLATPFGPAGRGWRDDWAAGVFLLCAFHGVLRVRSRLERRRPVLRLHLLLIGVGCALALALTPEALPGMLVVVGSAEVVLRSGLAQPHRSGAVAPEGGTRRALLAWGVVLAPVLVGLALLLWSSAVRFGHPLDFGQPLVGRADGGPWNRTVQWLGAPGTGVLLQVPLLVLLPFAFSIARTRHERLWPGVALAAVGAGLIGGMLNPNLEWGPGPPTLLPVLPIIWLGVPLALRSVAESAVLRWVTGLLIAIGLVVQLPHFLVHPATQRTLVSEVLEQELEGGAVDPLAVRHRAAWDPRLCAPWAQWRILRHRVAGMGESYPREVLFEGQEPGELRIPPGRLQGFRHLALVEREEQSPGRGWIGLLSALIVAVGGLALTLWGLSGRED